MSLTIREAVPGDEGLVLKFIKDLALYEKEPDAVETTEESLRGVLFCEAPKVFCNIGEWDGAPAGFALWFYTFSTWTGRHGIWLEDLFVEPDYRGYGLGKALIRELGRRCRDEGLGRLEWTVLDWNEPSIDFYKALGAVMMDEWTTCRMDGAALEALGAA